MSCIDYPSFGCPLPQSVVLEWATQEDWSSPLISEEEVFIQRAVLKRQSEFRAGRNAAHRCLRSIDALSRANNGLHNNDALVYQGSESQREQIIAVGEFREPIWPQGYVGSISHTQSNAGNYCLAVAALTDNIQSIGVDLEPLESLSADSVDLVVTPAEWRFKKENNYPECWEKYLFAAKESFYKCIFPLTGYYLDFLEAEFELIPSSHLFQKETQSGQEASSQVFNVKLRFLSPEALRSLPSFISSMEGYVTEINGLIRAVFWLTVEKYYKPYNL